MGWEKRHKEDQPIEHPGSVFVRWEGERSWKEAIHKFKPPALPEVMTVDTFKMIPFVVPDKKLIDLFIENVSPLLTIRRRITCNWTGLVFKITQAE
jgi:hypothetical protein